MPLPDRPPRPPTSPRDDRLLVVPSEAAGLRLDRFLAAAFPRTSRRRWMEFIKEGRVQVDGVRGRPGTTLRGDERLKLPPMEGTNEKAVPRVDTGPATEPDAPASSRRGRREVFVVDVLHRDGDLLVVSKPPGVPCHAGAGLGVVKTLLELLKDDVLEGFGLAHRLDRDTSGVIALVRGADMRAKLTEAFAADDVVEKTYDALVEGAPEDDAGTIDVALAEPGHGTRGRVDRVNGRPSRTDWVVVERFQGATRLRVTPRTGRTHQIRLHLESAGIPLLVDPLYGRRRGWRQVDPKGGAPARLTRTPLHASSLTLPHPRSGARLTFHAPLYPDHRRALEVLRVIAARGSVAPPIEEPIEDAEVDTSDVDGETS